MLGKSQGGYAKRDIERHLTVQEGDDLWEEAAPVPRCSSAQCSELPARQHQFKEVVARVCGVFDDFTCPLPHSGRLQVLNSGGEHQ